ncbi:MAG: hypothetical protein OEM91_00200 [Hyphomicrobiales bacterium]|nr:hypothetical protein [Hyphomicrobiales bacterium]
MKKLLAAIVFALALPGAGDALAQDFPSWSLSAICKDDFSCPRFEQHARGQISGIWPTLPPDARSTCMAETEKVEQSYRLLMDCLANEMQRRVRLGQQQR